MYNFRIALFMSCIWISFIAFADNISIPPSENIGIILLGDSGEDNENQTAVANAVVKYCDHNLCSFGLLLGDNFYDNGVRDIHDPQFANKFERPFQAINFTFYPVLGNHDIRGNWQAQIDYNSRHWQMGNRYYLIQVGWLKIFALDTNLFNTLQQKSDDATALQQLQWLNRELAHDNSSWKIIAGHHPVYSNGKHGDTWSLITYLQPILEKYPGTFYCAGHDHDKELIEHNKNVYIVSGATARPRAIQSKNDSEFSSSTPGFAHLLFNQQQATLRFINSEGTVEFAHTYKINEFQTATNK